MQFFCKCNFTFFVFLLAATSKLTVFSSKCFSELSDFCQCDQHTVNCSNFDAPLNDVLQILFSRNPKILILRKSWTDKPTTLLQSYHISSFHQLKVFDISQNRISSIESGTFRDFPNLLEINLSYNYLRIIEKDTFSGNLPRLQILDLSNNKILLLLDNTFRSMSSLSHLDLRNNTLFYVDENAFEGLNSLETLQMEGCRVDDFPGAALKSLRNLATFEAKDFKRIASLPANNFRSNFHLRRLHLENLRSLSSGNIHKLAFYGLSSLKILSLKSCNLSFVPAHAFHELKKLTKLDLSLNSIEVIKSYDFENLALLETLILHQNKLHTIMTASFSFCSNLQIIDLSANELTTLEKDIFSYGSFQTKAHIRMKNNPLTCDCSVAWIIKYRLVMDDSQTTCIKPQKVQGHTFSSLTLEHFKCPTVQKSASTVPPKIDRTPLCQVMHPISSGQRWNLPKGSAISLNISHFENQSTVVVLAYDDNTNEPPIHQCYIGETMAKKLNYKLPKSVHQSNKNDVSFLTPVVIGVAIMISCFGLMACVIFAMWSYRVKKENTSLKKELEFERPKLVL